MTIKELITELLNYPLDIMVEDNLSMITPLSNLLKSKITLGFRCDKCAKPSHAGQWGKSYPQPCFWCKGDYVYPGSKLAEGCTDFILRDINQPDYRPVLC